MRKATAGSTGHCNATSGLMTRTKGGLRAPGQAQETHAQPAPRPVAAPAGGVRESVPRKSVPGTCREVPDTRRHVPVPGRSPFMTDKPPSRSAETHASVTCDMRCLARAGRYQAPDGTCRAPQGTSVRTAKGRRQRRPLKTPEPAPGSSRPSSGRSAADASASRPRGRTSP